MLLASSDGRAVNFNVADLKPSLKGKGGVKGIKLEEGEQVVSMVILPTASSTTADVTPPAGGVEVGRSSEEGESSGPAVAGPGPHREERWLLAVSSHGNGELFSQVRLKFCYHPPVR